jgi:hypothetical protein
MYRKCCKAVFVVGTIGGKSTGPINLSLTEIKCPK